MLIWLVTFALVFLFADRGWWLPSNVADQNAGTHRQFLIIITALGVSFAVAQTSIGYVVRRFRTTRGKEAAAAPQASHVAEIAWAAATAIVFFLLAMMGQYVWLRLRPR